MTDETRDELARALWRIHAGATRVRFTVSPDPNVDRASSLKRAVERFAAKKRLAIDARTIKSTNGRTFHVFRLDCSTRNI